VRSEEEKTQKDLADTQRFETQRDQIGSFNVGRIQRNGLTIALQLLTGTTQKGRKNTNGRKIEQKIEDGAGVTDTVMMQTTQTLL
jgi:hypothetical protein